VWFIHGARNGRAHVRRDDVRQLAGSGTALRTHFAYSQPAPEDLAGRDYDHRGRIDITTLTALLDPLQTDFYLCGPNDFMMALKAGLTERGVPKERIRMEIFGAGDSRPGTVTSPPATVTFARSGVTAKWTSADGPLLDLALGKNLDAPYVCRQGDCQSCAQKLLAGTVAYPADLDIEPTEGHVLLCQATPMGDVSIDL
jgi:ferredoxin